MFLQSLCVTVTLMFNRRFHWVDRKQVTGEVGKGIIVSYVPIPPYSAYKIDIYRDMHVLG